MITPIPLAIRRFVHSTWPQRARTWRIALITAAIFTAPARGQTDPAHRSALIAKGFTAAEFKAAERAIVMPHFRYYDAWQRCTRAALHQGNQMQGNTKQVMEFVVAICSDESRSLQASLGASLGVATATRVILLLYRDFELTLKASNPQAQAEASGKRLIRDWLLTKGKQPGSCMIVKELGEPSAIGFLHENNRTVLLIFEKNDHTYDRVEQRGIEFGDYAIGYNRRLKSFNVTKSSDPGYVALTTELNADDIEVMKQSFGFKLLDDADMKRDLRESRDKKFLFGGQGREPLEALLSC